MSLRILTKFWSFWRHTLVSSTCDSSQLFQAGAWNVKPRFRKEFSGIPAVQRLTIGGSLHNHSTHHAIHSGKCQFLNFYRSTVCNCTNRSSCMQAHHQFQTLETSCYKPAHRYISKKPVLEQKACRPEFNRLMPLQRTRTRLLAGHILVLCHHSLACCLACLLDTWRSKEQGAYWK